jgi:hypothetical protein
MVLTNATLKYCVQAYLSNKARLPEELRNIPIGQWDVSHVTDMNELFRNRRTFNESLNNWDVSNVTDMNGMFSGCSAYNHSMDNWNVSRVVDMSFMFKNTTYNQSLNMWNVSNVKSMSGMFNYSQYNQPLNNWNVSNVITMSGMFLISQYNHPLNNWIVSNVKLMDSMFKNSVFNYDLSQWNVSNVISTYAMFGDSVFNHSLNNWNIGNVIDMRFMFKNSQFNQPLDNWINHLDRDNVVGAQLFTNCPITPIPRWTLIFRYMTRADERRIIQNNANILMELEVNLLDEIQIHNRAAANEFANIPIAAGYPHAGNEVVRPRPVRVPNPNPNPNPVPVRIRDPNMFVPNAGIAYNVHNVFASVRMDKLMEILRETVGPLPVSSTGGMFVFVRSFMDNVLNMKYNPPRIQYGNAGRAPQVLDLRTPPRQAPCPAGMERNPETMRCRKACRPDQIRNPTTKRCVQRPAREIDIRPVPVQPACPPGMERNPETMRCRKECRPDQIRNPTTKRCVQRPAVIVQNPVLERVPTPTPVIAPNPVLERVLTPRVFTPRVFTPRVFTPQVPTPQVPTPQVPTPQVPTPVLVPNPVLDPVRAAEIQLANEARFTKMKLGLNLIFDRLGRAVINDPSLTANIKTVVAYVSAQTVDIQQDYVEIFIDESVNAFNSVTSSNMSCPKGIIERLFLSLKNALLVACTSPELCLPQYKRILEEGFRVITINDLSQKWSEERLGNEEFLLANRLNAGNPQRRSNAERIAFLKKDYIKFAKVKYAEQLPLVKEIIDKINEEADRLQESGVFDRMEFGGGSRRRQRRNQKYSRHKS